MSIGNRYYQQGALTQPQLSFVRGKYLSTSAIAPPLPTVNRSVNGGNSATGSATSTVNPNYTRWRWDGTGSATVHYYDGNGVLQNHAVSNTTFTFFALTNAPYGIPTVTGQVGQGSLLGPSGQSGTNSNQISIVLNFLNNLASNNTVNVTVRNSLNIVVATIDLVCNAGNTVYNFPNVINSTIQPVSGYSVTVNSYTPSISGTGFTYSIVTPGGYTLPADITIHYNDSNSTTKDEIIRVTANGQILKTFTNANDPILAYGGVFTIIAASNPSGGSNSPAPFPGWQFDFNEPFFIIGSGSMFQNMNTGGLGGASYPLGGATIDGIDVQSIGDLLLPTCLKNAMNIANAKGIPDANAIANNVNQVSYLAGDFEKHFEKEFNNPNYPVSFWVTIANELNFFQYWTNKKQLQDATLLKQDPDIQEILTMIGGIENASYKEYWGAPGSYFIPDERISSPSSHSPYWNGYQQLLDLVGNNTDVVFAVVTLKSIN